MGTDRSRAIVRCALSAIAATLVAAAAVVVPAGSALAHPGHDEHDAPSSGGADPSVGFDNGPVFLTTNVEHLGTIPLNADSAGGRVVGDRFYITDDRGLTIYDTTDPVNPVQVGFLAVPQTVYIPEEDVDTNGEILLIGSDILDALVVIDVSTDDPTEIGRLSGSSAEFGENVDSHTTTCVLDCTYAYNSNGLIIDLTDPTDPTAVGNWNLADDALPDGDPLKTPDVTNSHDVTEVAPGIVITSSNPIVVLDANTDPANPTILAKTAMPDSRYNHGNLWPDAGQDRWLLMGTESVGDCDTELTTGGLDVYDTQDWQTTGTFVETDNLRLELGSPADGLSVYDQYCGHWFTEHPDYLNNGIITMGWYEHGARFIQIDRTDGHITEIGWFVPVGGSTSGAYWITDEIVYTTDYQRGIDILRFTVDEEPTAAVPEVANPILLPIVAMAGLGFQVVRSRRRLAAA